MENFNPIKELKPEDSFNAAEGESSDEIESIRLTLISTRKKTRELVNVIKKKNSDFVKDTTTIKDLDRRLRITIARIPIMRGDASTRSDQDPSMIFRAFNRRSRTNTPTDTRVRPTPKFRERIINFAIDLALTFFGGRVLGAIFRRGGAKLFNNNLTKDALEELIKKTKNIDDIKIPVKASAAEKAAGFNIPNFFKKTFTPKLTPAQIKAQNIKKTLEEAKGKTGLFEKNVRVNRENFFDRGSVKNAASDYTGPGDLIGTQISRTVKVIKNIVKTKPNVNVTRSRRRNIKNLRGQDKVTYSDKTDVNAIKKQSEKANEIQKEIYKNFNELNKLNKKIKELENQLVKISGSKTLSEAEKKTRQLIIQRTLDELRGTRRIIKKRNPTSTYNKTKAFNFNTKPMSNDIAMLNRDTSVTRTVVIATGEIA